MIYETGTTHGKDDYKSQTPLAKRCSPPERPAPGRFTAGTGVILSAAAALKAGYLYKWNEWVIVGTFGASLLALGILWFMLFGRRWKARYEKLYATWEKSWVCLKCGDFFQE